MSTNADHPGCDPLRKDIGRRLLMCNVDELEVLDQLLGRIEKGRDSYGFLDLEKARDWDRELAEELLDVSVYKAVQAVKDRQFSQLCNQAADELLAESVSKTARENVERFGSVHVEPWKCGWCGAFLENDHHALCLVGKVAKWP